MLSMHSESTWVRQAIEAGAKGTSGAGQHHDADGVVVRGIIERRDERAREGAVHRIQLVGAVERDRADPGGAGLDAQVCVFGHAE